MTNVLNDIKEQYELVQPGIDIKTWLVHDTIAQIEDYDNDYKNNVLYQNMHTMPTDQAFDFIVKSIDAGEHKLITN